MRHYKLQNKLFLVVGLLIQMLLMGCNMKTEQAKQESSPAIEEAFPITSALLKDTEWERLEDPPGGSFTIKFTDRQMLSHFTREDGSGYSSTCCYYLSPVITQKFDSTKVGTDTRGHYLVMGSYNYYEIAEIGLSEMVWKYPDSGVIIHFRRK